MSKLDEVFDMARQQPILPIEIASKLGMDSFLAKAYLDQLVEAGKLKATTEKVGGVSVYFAPSQEVVADAKVKKLLGIKPAARNFAASVPQGAEVEKKRAEFLVRLKEIEDREQKLAERKAKAKTDVLKIKKVVMPAPEVVLEQEPEVEEQKPPEIEKVETEKEIKVAEEKPKVSFLEDAKRFIAGEQSTVVEASLSWLAEKGAEVISKEMKKRGKEAIITVTVPSGIGPMNFLVFVVNKKSISEADLSIAYSEGVQKKYPVIVVSKGRLTKVARNYLKVISGVVKFKQLE